ncbi:MAG: hypothetical protein HC789_10410 [Microcoleus sp. CSU_2_2]|nr:hypothetical protein [Microcoleus sp. CSU_2_2]
MVKTRNLFVSSSIRPSPARLRDRMEWADGIVTSCDFHPAAKVGTPPEGGIPACLVNLNVTYGNPSSFQVRANNRDLSCRLSAATHHAVLN